MTTAQHDDGDDGGQTSENILDPGRFLLAQEGVYRQVLHELSQGRKRSHWMWYVFPQLDGLGHSAMACHYAIRSFDAAKLYLHHPVLGERLLECTRLVNGLQGRTLREIFGPPDDLKFCSSMTLFEQVAGPESVFSAALDKYCDGRRDGATLARLSGDG
jgi:uncharacterized protein (DUF1810 family)